MVKKTGKKLVLSAAFVLAMTLAGCGTGGTSQSTAPASQSTAPTSQSTHEHAYGAPVWDWADLDNGNVFAKFSCTCGDTQKKKATLDGSDKKDATCTEAGYVNWKAEVEFLSQKYQDTKKVDKAAKGHHMTYVTADPATCTKEGILAHYRCDQCEKNFQDEQGQTEMKSVVDPIKAHTLTEVQEKAATCYEDGVKVHHWHCSVCEQNFEDAEGKTKITGSVVAPKINHVGFCSKTDAVAATCDKDGNIDYWHCTKCGDYWDDEQLTHEISLEQTKVAATHHAGTLAKVDAKAATCTEDGNITYWYCSACKKYFDSEDCSHQISQSDTVIGKLGHTLNHVDAKAATCTEAGNIEHYHCTREGCGKNFSDAAGKTPLDNVIINAKGHTYSESSCTVCGMSNLVKVSNMIRVPENLSSSTEKTAPKGFIEVYKYNGDIGGGEAEGTAGNSLLKWGASYANYGYVEFGIYVPAGRYTALNPNGIDSEKQAINGQYRAGLTNGDEWYIYRCNRDSMSSDTWTVSVLDSDRNPVGLYKDTGEWTPIGEELVITVKPDDVTYHRFNPFFKVIFDKTIEFTYITEIAGYGICHDHHAYGTLINAKDATCQECGYKVNHYHCIGCGKYFNEQFVEIPETDVVIDPLSHNYDDNGKCSICNRTIFAYDADRLQDPSHISEITDGSVAKSKLFNKVYLYNTTTGGGTAGGFFKHAGNVGLGSWENPRITTMDFAVKAYDSNSAIKLRNNTGGAQIALGDCTDWVYVHAYLDTTNEEWVFSNSANSTTFNSTAGNTMFSIWQLLNDSQMYITEFLVTFTAK